jgi:hypothetical protein
LSSFIITLLLCCTVKMIVNFNHFVSFHIWKWILFGHEVSLKFNVYWYLQFIMLAVLFSDTFTKSSIYSGCNFMDFSGTFISFKQIMVECCKDLYHFCLTCCISSYSLRFTVLFEFFMWIVNEGKISDCAVWYL